MRSTVVLPDPERSDDRDDLVLGNVQIERVQNYQIAVSLGDVGEPNNGCIGLQF